MVKRVRLKMWEREQIRQASSEMEEVELQSIGTALLHCSREGGENGGSCIQFVGLVVRTLRWLFLLSFCCLLFSFLIRR